MLFSSGRSMRWDIWKCFWHGCLLKGIVSSNAGRLNVWIAQRLSWLPFVLLSIVFIMSTLSLWRLHCETLRIQCNARPSLPGCWVCTNCAIYVTYARPTYSDRGVEFPQKHLYWSVSWCFYFLLWLWLLFFFFLCHQFQYSAIQISRHFHTSKLQINLTKFFLHVVVLLRQLLTVWSAMIILLKTWPRRSAVTASKKTADIFFFPFMQKFNELPCHFHKNSTSKWMSSNTPACV